MKLDLNRDFEFKSQIHTTLKQSKRLVTLGFKKETADCCHYYVTGVINEEIPEDANYPAWSLHRLIEMIDINITIDSNIVYVDRVMYEIWDEVYENLIDAIETLIKEKRFNTNYLKS